MQSKQSFSWKVLTGALLANLVGLACLHWDIEISQAARGIKLRGDLNKAVQLSEIFGHAIGPIAIFFTLIQIDTVHRRALWKAAWFTAICGISANLAKFVIPRLRPHSFDRSVEEISSSWHTWGIPWTGSWHEEHLRSFPSGHSATAVGLAIGLTYVYPRGKWIFSVFAAAACLQRLVSGAHFVSDIMGGTVMALVISFWYWKTFPAGVDVAPEEELKCQEVSPSRNDSASE